MANKYSVSISNAVRAKLLCVYGKCLKTADYESLINCDSMQAAVRILSGTARYAGIFDSVSESVAHRGLVEDLLRKDELLLFERLSGFIRSGKNDFFSFLIKRVEIELVLNSVMFVSISAYDKLAASLPVYLKQYLSFDVTAFAAVKDFRGFINVLSGTRYAKILERHAGEDLGSVSYETLSRDLYDEYWRWLFAYVNLNTSGGMRQELRRVISITFDVENLRTCYRMKKHFSRSGDEILNSISLPAKFLSGDRQRLLSESASAEDVLAELESKYFKGRAGDPEEDLEVAIRRYKKMLYGRLIHTSESGIVALYAFSELLELERQNVVAIIECIRYEVPVEFIRKLAAL